MQKNSCSQQQLTENKLVKGKVALVHKHVLSTV
jgi:hypothetical protein